MKESDYAARDEATDWGTFVNVRVHQSIPIVWLAQAAASIGCVLEADPIGLKITRHKRRGYVKAAVDAALKAQKRSSYDIAIERNRRAVGVLGSPSKATKVEIEGPENE